MQYYIPSSYTGKTRKRKKQRIVFLVVLSVAILTAFFLLGNLLYDRLAQTELLMQYAPYEYTPPADTVPPLPTPVPPAKPSVSAGVFCRPDVTAYTDRETASRLCALAAELYSGLSVPVTDDGVFLYAFSFVPQEDGTFLPTDSLSMLTAAAKKSSLTVTAVADLPDNPTDAAMIGAELTRLGFDEVLFLTPLSATLSEGGCDRLLATAEAVRSQEGEIRVGFSLSADMLRDAVSSAYLSVLAAEVDFLALSTTGAEDPTALCESLYGSIGYFSLRILVGGSDADVSGVTESLRVAGYTDILPVLK